MTPARPLRILHVLQAATIGGAQRRIWETSRLIPPERASVEVALLTARGRLSAELEAMGLRCHVLDIRGAADVPRAAVRLVAIMRRGRFDVVHTHLLHSSAAGLAAALLAGVPVRVMTRGQVHVARTGSFLDRSLSRLSNALAQRIFTVGADVRDAIVREEGVPPKRVEVIPNGVDVAYLRSLAGERASHDGFVMGTVARLHPQKGYDIAIDAVKALADAGVAVRYEIVGEGPLRGRLEEQAARLGVADRVDLVGFVRNPFPRELGWDLYLHPSNDEGLSNAILEAMALGRPIVATDVTGAREQIVDGESGLIVPPGDPGAMARAVRRLRDDPSLAARFGDAAVERVERLFDLRRSAERYMEAYAQLLARAPRRVAGRW